MQIRPDAPHAEPVAGSPGGRSPRQRLKSIRWQIVAAIAGVSCVTSALLLPYAHDRIEASLHGFETAHARQEAHRLEVLLGEQAESLKRTALDYSRWDDAVDFIRTPSTEWVDENLAHDVLENFGAELIVVADANLEVLARRTTLDRAMRVEARGHAIDTVLCHAAMSRVQPVHRFEVHHGAAHLVVCSPVYSPQAPAAVVGVMMWVVELTGNRLDVVRELARFGFALRPATPPIDHAMRFDADMIRLSTPIRDFDGRPSLVARMQVPRPLGEQRRLISRVVLTLLGTALAVPPLLALLLLDILVVRRIRRMSAWVRALRWARPVELPQRLESMTEGRAGFFELQTLGRDVSALARHLESVRAGWQKQALRDELTGLPNRACLIADVERHLESHAGPLALLVIDLDGFKAVNDMLGHGIGDDVLVEAARRFEAILPPHACAYRLGGDEFAIVAMPSSREDGESIARLIASEMRFVRHAEGRPIAVSASTGIALSGDDADSRSVSALLSEADAAMYEAKRTGRGVWRRTSPGVRTQQREQIEVSGALRGALAAGRLQAWFQPIVHARGGALLAVEALARWHEPGWGAVSPLRFIPAAERSGQILELDLAIMASALPPFARLHAARPELRLHLNASAQTIADPTYPERFTALLAQHGVDARAIVLELTESDLAVEHLPMEATLRTLRDAGVGLSVDDFGVGASSLARLSVLKPDCIKIDGSFVRDITGMGGPICRVVIELARELGMTCIAEYVETDTQAAALAGMGCNALQGYGPGAPVPAAEFTVARSG